MKRNKVLTLVILVTFLVISYITPYQWIFASSELLNEQTQLTQEQKDQMNDIASIVGRYKYFGDMTDEEQNKICGYFGVDRESILKIEELKVGFPDSINLVLLNNNWNLGFKPEELKTMFDIYKDTKKLHNEIIEFRLYAKKYSLKEEVLNNIKYLLAGYTLTNIVDSYAISIVLNLDMEKLLYKKEAEDSEDSKIFNRYDVNKKTILKYIDENKISLIELETLIENFYSEEDDMIIGIKSSQPEINYNKYLENPYKFNENTYESVSFNNGSLNFENTAVVLDGVNGLDLIIKAQYQLSQANMYLYDYFWDDKFCKYVEYTRYKDYIYSDSTPTNTIIVSTHQITFMRDSEAELNFTIQCNETNTYTNGPFPAGWLDENGNPVTYIEYNYIVHDYVSPLYMDGYYASGTNSYTYLHKTYNLGIGWSFEFSSIETYIDDKYLHLSTGEIYKINFTPTAGDSNLKDYPLKDIRLETDSGNYSNASGTSAYVLIYKDGKREYFSYNGRLLGIRDRFMNTIDFIYCSFNGYTVIDYITDSVGRVVNFTYSQLSGEQRVVITLPDNNTITYILESINYETNAYNLTEIIDTAGRSMYFDYEISTVNFAFDDKYTRDASNKVSKLVSVTYPTSVVSNYAYQMYVRNMGNLGSEEYYRVIQRKETVNIGGVNVNYNLKNFNYSGNYTGYSTYYDPNNLPDTYTYSCTETNTDGLKIKRTFNYKHNLIKEEWLNNSDALISKTENTYNTGTRQLVKQKNTRYNSAQNTMITYENFQYDTGGFNNLTGYWNKLASRDANGNPLNDEHKITYTYDSAYHLLSQTEYKRDDDTMVQTVNTLILSGKAVGENRVNEIIGTNPAELKEKTGYSYDSHGNVIEEKKYIKTGDPQWSEYISVLYSYNDNVPARNGLLDGLYVTEVTTTGVKDAYGNLVPPVSGGTAGCVSVKYVYDTVGNLTSYIDAAGNETSYQYDNLNRMTLQTYPDNTQASITYDDLNNFLTVTDQNGTSIRKEYDKLGNHVRDVEVEFGSVLIFNEYDNMMRLIRSVNADGSSKTENIYAVDGRLSSKIIKDTWNATVYRENYAYDDAYANGTYAKVTKTIPGETGAPDIVMVEYHDPYGRKAKDGYVSGGVEYLNNYFYDYAGNVIQTVSARHTAEGWLEPYTQKFEYDYAGRTVKAYDIDGNYITTEYDSIGRKTKVTDPKGNVATNSYSTLFEYDNIGRLLRAKTPFEQEMGGNVNYAESVYEYDLNGNVVSLSQSNNPIGEPTTYRRTDYEYDNMNRLVSVSLCDSGQGVLYTQYYYDAKGDKLRMYTGLSSPLTITGLDIVVPGSDFEYSVTKYEYDRFGNLTKLTDPLNQDTVYTYDLNGRQTQSIDRNGTVIMYTYDALGNKLTEIAYNPDDSSKSLSYTYAYTLTGMLKAVTGEGENTIYTYDEAGRPVSEQNAGGILKSYLYDVASNKTSSVVTVNGIIQSSTGYSYDKMNRLSSVYDGVNMVATYTYDVNGNRSSLIYENGNVTEYEYNVANMVTGLTNKVGSVILEDYIYEYNLDGNHIKKTELVSGIVTDYVYDDLNRLTSETVNDEMIPISQYTYEYDDYNNRTSKTDINLVVTEYEYDLNNRLTTEIYTQADVNYETRYGYDNNGNLTVTYKSETKPYDPLVTGSVSVIFLEEDTLGLMTFYRYDGFNRLTSVNTSQTDALYAYTYDGLRKSKTVNGVTTAHIWVGSQIVLDIHDESIIKYIRGINLIARDDGTDRDFYLFNAHGDVTALTDTTGVITKSYHYDAFGNETNPDATDDNPFRYCGEYFDKETGTIYLRARYYNPATSRMLSEDTHWNVGNMVYGDDPLKLNEYTMVPNILAIMQSGNLYVYCMSNPIMYVDPDGKKLAFPGQIHREVAENIVRNNRSHLLSRERWVRYPTTILNKEVSALGRVDLVDLKTGYIWEIKPDKWPKVAAIEQLKRYESGKFLNKIFSDTKMEIYMGDGTGYALSGSFKYSIYDVSYKYEGNGIITYTYQADRDRVAKEVLNTVVEGGLALLVILIEIARSKGVPVPIPSY